MMNVLLPCWCRFGRAPAMREGDSQERIRTVGDVIYNSERMRQAIENPQLIPLPDRAAAEIRA